MTGLDAECAVRLASFAGIFLMLLIGEWLAPRRVLTIRKSLRWLSNLGLVGLNTLAVRLLAPASAVGLALLAGERSWGLFNNLALPGWLAAVLAFIALDLAIYCQHVLFHAVPVLWRVHMVHHVDIDLDVSSGLRFHTIEILLSLGIKLAVVAALGAPALAVLLFEVVLNASSMFNHSNIRLPAWLDRLLRLLIVTPDMHRLHHSVLERETNSNFGFNLPWWDHLFGTYRAQPAAGHEHMAIGLPEFREDWVDRLPWMLLLPFLPRQAAAQKAAEACAARSRSDSVKVGCNLNCQAEEQPCRNA